MSDDFVYTFSFDEPGVGEISGELNLSGDINSQGVKKYRAGELTLENGTAVSLSMAHSPSTAAFIYLDEHQVSPDFFDLIEYPGKEGSQFPDRILLPGQLVLGATRTVVLGQAVLDTLSAPCVSSLLEGLERQHIITVPVLREGIKYQVADALLKLKGYYCDEIVTDAHHILDEDVTSYRRSVHVSLFKDADLTNEQRQEVTTAFVGDSIASGTVLLGVFGHITKQFPNVKRVEVVAPFLTVRGLARLAHFAPEGLDIRFHVFETLLNALPPEYYFSAHFSESKFHIRPDLQEQYEQWWGFDENGNSIAATACAGYGWSEAFFTPRKHIQLMNQELQKRHGLTIAQILKRNLNH